MSERPSIRWEGTPFAMVPRWIVRHPDLSSRAVHLFSLLATYTDDKHDEAWPSLKTLAGFLNCKTTSVANAKRELVQAGAVRVEERPGTSNVYVLQGSEPRQHADAPPSTERRTPRQPVDAEVDRGEVEPGSRRAPAARTHDDTAAIESFEQWYTAYPRKVARKRALTAYAKALRDGADPDTLLEEATRLASRDVAKRFIPHPTTWLNQGRWEDDLDEVYPAETKKGYNSESTSSNIRAGLGL